MVEKETLKKVGIGLGVGVAAGVAAPLAATAALGAVGFSAGGVVAGSIAAGIQASIGNVAAGSLFASKSHIIRYFSSLKNCPLIVVCQSVGAAGFAASTTTGVAVAGTGIGGLVGGLWPGGKKSNNEASDNSHDNDDEPKGDNSVSTKEAGPSKTAENGTIMTEEKKKIGEEIEHFENDAIENPESNLSLKSIQNKPKSSWSIEIKHENNPYYGIQKMLYPEDEYEELIVNTGTQTDRLPSKEDKEEKFSVHLDVRTPIGWGISAGLDSSRACIKQTM